MRRTWTTMAVCAVALAMGACEPGDEPAETGAETGEVSVAPEPIQPGDPAPGSFESGDTRGWATAQGDESRTDFETGDASAWSQTEGDVEEPAGTDGDDDGGR